MELKGVRVAPVSNGLDVEGRGDFGRLKDGGSVGSSERGVGSVEGEAACGVGGDA